MITSLTQVIYPSSKMEHFPVILPEHLVFNIGR